MDKELEKAIKEYDNIQVPYEVDLIIEAAMKKGKRKKKASMIKSVIAVAASFILILSFYKLMQPFSHNEIMDSSKKIALNNLPSVNSYENLKSLLSGFNVQYYQEYNVKKSVNPNLAGDITKDGDTHKTYSGTNVQVDGVDEGDKIKTDGRYIYKMSSGKLDIIKAVPAESMALISSTQMDYNFANVEMLLKDSYAVVIGSEVVNYKADQLRDDIISYDNKTHIIIYDVKNPAQPKKVRSIDLEGVYLQARNIGDSIYVIANKGLNYYANTVKDYCPVYKDSAVGNKNIIVDYNQIQYCKDALAPNYIMIATIDLKNIDKKADITAILGSGTNIYVSQKNIYVTRNSNDTFVTHSMLNIDGINTNQGTTTIYKFKLNGNSTSFIASGEVKGTILNKYSMDENNDFLRVVTTESQETGNSLFILDSNMKQVGSIEGIAKGEIIYSARFLGDKGYMVTFKQTDPLFVLDLKVPTAPKILGELKIPGFSTYLQFYDENHIIGFGTENSNTGSFVKLALFNVEDPNKPVEQFKVKVDGQYSYSRALYEPKSILFDKERQILAMPIQSGVIDKVGKYSFYLGANIYSINLKDGIKLKGQISHNDISEVNKGYDMNYEIQRELYIGQNLYTISNGLIKANDMESLKEISKVSIK